MVRKFALAAFMPGAAVLPLAQAKSEALGQQVVIENRSGGPGNIGSELDKWGKVIGERGIRVD